jgi:hypothetical protein
VLEAAHATASWVQVVSAMPWVSDHLSQINQGLVCSSSPFKSIHSSTDRSYPLLCPAFDSSMMDTFLISSITVARLLLNAGLI